MTTVLLTYPPDGALARLPELFPKVTFHFALVPEEQERLLADTEVLVCNGRTYLPRLAEAVKRSPRLRWLQMCSAGVERPLESGLPRHVLLTRGGGLWNVSVAEHALALMLALVRHLPEAERERQERRWDAPTARARIGTLEGRRLLILGFGDIGGTLARRAAALGMEITGVRRNPVPVPGVRTLGLGEFHQALANTDVLAILLPGGPDTIGLVGARELALMPPGALLVNVGRGTAVDTPALVEALRSGPLAGAGLDVCDPEPLPPDHPLWTLPNVIITPHCAADTPRWAEKIAALVERNLRSYLAGEPLEYQVAH